MLGNHLVVMLEVAEKAYKTVSFSTPFFMSISYLYAIIDIKQNRILQQSGKLNYRAEFDPYGHGRNCNWIWSRDPEMAKGRELCWCSLCVQEVLPTPKLTP